MFPEFRGWSVIQDLLTWEKNSLWLKQIPKDPAEFLSKSKPSKHKMYLIQGIVNGNILLLLLVDMGEEKGIAIVHVSILNRARPASAT